MGKLLLVVLIPFFLGVGDSKRTGKDDSYEDDGETRTERSWIDIPGLLHSTIDKMISTRIEREVIFLSFSRTNKEEPHYVTNANFTSWEMEESNLDPTVKTVFIIHGYKDDNAIWIRKMKDALILRENCNVFILEFSQPAKTWTNALEDIPKVGKQVAIFIQNLKKSTGVDLEKIHIIGHSAGAQTAGFAGKEIKKMTKKLLGRITGLDPAGPGFYSAGPDQRLDAADASFVDIIHTNMGYSSMGGLGLPKAIGHFDFYPNGGELQPGCLTSSQFFEKVDFKMLKIMVKYVFGSVRQEEAKVLKSWHCSHQRAYEYFTASIMSECYEFRSVKCSSWNRYLSGQCDDNDKVVMGYRADRYKDFAEEGILKKFYLNTTSHEPYCN